MENYYSILGYTGNNGKPNGNYYNIGDLLGIIENRNFIVHRAYTGNNGKENGN